jgi:hypothetical protein
MSGLSLAEEVPDEPVVPLENPPKTLMHWAVLILNTANPMLKVRIHTQFTQTMT